MLCKIADLLIEVPEAGGMAPRCRGYLTNEQGGADITIRADLYKAEKYGTAGENMVAYMESCVQFCRSLIHFDGFYLHSSAVELDGKAYLFSGPSGMGKSTHTRLWQSLHGDAAQVFNDDKPALRYLDGRWFAYGTPWCGKERMGVNAAVPLRGICLLSRGAHDVVRPVTPEGYVNGIIRQVVFPIDTPSMIRGAHLLGDLVRTVPAIQADCTPTEHAAEMVMQALAQHS